MSKNYTQKMFNIKDYDKKLISKKEHDGSVTIYRVSPYGADREHYLFTISGQFVGSGRWIREKLIRMDTHRFDIVGEAQLHNKRLKKYSKNNSRQMSNEIADMFATGGDIFKA